MKMQKHKALCIVVSMMLIMACTAGCEGLFSTAKTTGKVIYTNPTETTLDIKDKSVKDLLGISLDTVQTLKILRAGDGFTVVIDDKAQIGRILDRLNLVSFSVDLGKQGYTPDGYGLEFTCKDQNGETKVGIQLDTSEHTFIGSYNRHFYSIVDSGAYDNGNLNTYFEEAQYK
jgi:hypothetical protein